MTEPMTTAKETTTMKKTTIKAATANRSAAQKALRAAQRNLEAATFAPASADKIARATAKLDRAREAYNKAQRELRAAQGGAGKATPAKRTSAPRRAPAAAPEAGRKDPRLAKIKSLSKEYGGQVHRVGVRQDGTFTYGGESYRSLSGIAKAITGTIWNGFLFFGLATRGERKAA